MGALLIQTNIYRNKEGDDYLGSKFRGYKFITVGMAWQLATQPMATEASSVTCISRQNRKQNLSQNWKKNISKDLP